MALVVWAAALEARARAAARRCSLLLGAGRAAAARGVVPGRRCTSCGWPGGRRGASASATRRWPRSAPLAVGGASTSLVTGDPLFSLHYTSSSAEDLGRQRTLGELPAAMPAFFANLVKLPVLLGRAASGSCSASVLAPRADGDAARAAAARASARSCDRRRRRVGDRALPGRPGAGADGVRRGRDRRLDDAAPGPAADARGRSARSLLVLAASSSPPRASTSTRFDNELRFRGQAHADLTARAAATRR